MEPIKLIVRALEMNIIRMLIIGLEEDMQESMARFEEFPHSEELEELKTKLSSMMLEDYAMGLIDPSVKHPLED